MLPMKCEASTSGSGTCSDSSSVASSVAGVTPEMSSIRPTMKVYVASSSGARLTAARVTGVTVPRRTSCTTSSASASSSGST